MTVTLDRIGIAVPATRPTPPPTAAPPSTSKVAAPPRPDFTTGFCGNGVVCQDRTGACRYAVTNGADAAVKILYCSCDCHDDHRDPEDPALSST